MPKLDLQLFFLGIKIDRFQKLTRSTGQRLLALEDNLLQFRREATDRLAEHALEKNDHTQRKGEIFASLEDIFRLKVVLNHEHGHVTDDFR